MRYYATKGHLVLSLFLVPFMMWKGVEVWILAAGWVLATLMIFVCEYEPKRKNEENVCPMCGSKAIGNTVCALTATEMCDGTGGMTSDDE